MTTTMKPEERKECEEAMAMLRQNRDKIRQESQILAYKLKMNLKMPKPTK